MAILDAVPGIRVTVQSGGRTLEEYPDEADLNFKAFRALDSQKSKCYIECTSDADFQLTFELLPGLPRGRGTHICFWVSVDGQEVGGCSPLVSSAPLSRVFDHAVEMINAREVIQRTLRFCSIKKVDDADSTRVKEDVKLANGLGEIIVHVHHATMGQPLQEPGRLKDPTTEVAEKALKGQAISHGVSFGPERRVQQAAQPQPIYPEGYWTPLGLFRFKYRSREALQAEMIIPRSPSPDVVMGPLNPRNANERNRESNQERLARLRREIQELEGDEDVKPQIKKEDRKRGSEAPDIQSGRAYKTSRKQNGTVVVDLTDD